MAVIKPFKGIRPPQELVEQVASRPYDVLNSEEAREEAKGNEKSLYHIIKPEIDFPMRAFTKRLPRILNYFRIRVGWYKMTKRITTSMPKR